MKLGIFDSGIGGEAIAADLRRTLPDAAILTVNDHANVPYGEKSRSEVITLTDAAIQPLLAAHCDIIILACNTATAVAIEHLRASYPHQKFIGIEPMIKTAAALTKTGTIAVCATRATLGSERYASLLETYAAHLSVIEPDCSQWAYWIEHNELNHAHVKEVITNACDRGADVIVLGCTHYHWIKEEIISLAGSRATILEPSDAIGRRVEQLLQLR